MVNYLVKIFVLFFACLGVFIDFIGSCNAFTWSSPDVWGRNQEKASFNHQTKLHKLSMYISIFEDIPQLILANIVASQQQKITLFFILTTIGSGLNIIRNIILNLLYLKLKKKATDIIYNQKKNSVTYNICGYKYLTFNIILGTYDQALEVENPKYIQNEIIELCC